MKLKGLIHLVVCLVFALFSYGTANAQVKDAVKDAAKKTVDVTKKAADKTKDVTVDAAKKTADATVDGTKAAASGAKTFGNYTVNVVDNVAGQAYEGGKWLATTTWDGTKWVTKRVWYKTKKVADKTEDAVTGDDDKNKP